MDSARISFFGLIACVGCNWFTLSNAAVIDFETVSGAAPFEGLEISDQYRESNGVVFSLSGGGSPVIAEVGAPTTAFANSDTAAPGQGVGRFFLTDDGQLTGLEAQTLVVSYDTPTGSASGAILDIDFDERFTISLFDSIVGGALLDTIEFVAGQPDTGNGIASDWSFNRPDADVLRLEFEGSRAAAGVFGLGFDNFDSGIAATPDVAPDPPQTVPQMPSSPTSPSPSMPSSPIAPVPLPMSLPMFLTAIGLLAFCARRRTV